MRQTRGQPRQREKDYELASEDAKMCLLSTVLAASDSVIDLGEDSDHEKQFSHYGLSSSVRDPATHNRGFHFHIPNGFRLEVKDVVTQDYHVSQFARCN
jgi:hypothetical protein